MIVSYSVKVKMNNKHIKRYIGLGYVCKVNEIIDVKIEHLTKGSSAKILAKCEICNNKKEISYKEYNIIFGRGGFFTCSRKCGIIKTKLTNLERYGVENISTVTRNKAKETCFQRYGVSDAMKSDVIKDKFKKTCLERYGVDHISKLDSVKDKIKETNLERYGVEHSSKSEYIKIKVKNTNIERYGVYAPSKSKPILDKMKETCFQRYGVDNWKKSENYFLINNIGNTNGFLYYKNNGISLFNCDKGHIFEIHSDNYHARTKNNILLCTICNPIGDLKSIKEKDLYNDIKNIYSGKIISSYRDGLEIDIYLPDLKLGFEFNGLYYHSDKFKNKNYHLNKTNHFKDKGIHIIHIWEDDWTFKQDIVKSQIKNLIGINEEKIFARKCTVKEITDSKLTRQFLDANHIQGHVNSSIKLGLYHNDELVSIMTFDSFEGRKKMEEGGYNLSRFCNVINTNVVGGASKLLSYFIKNYSPTRIVSYADKDWSIGQLYYTLGFTNISKSKPDYKYIVNNKRVHKSRYKKSKLKTTLTEAKQMELNGINKIYDCSKIKFELISDNL